MNSSTADTFGHNRRRIRAEAGAWIARLHGPGRTPALEAALRCWLGQSPLHAKEFELATDVWNESGALGQGGRPILPSGTRSHRRVKGYRPITTVVALCLMGLAWVLYAWFDSTLATGVGEQKTVSLADGTRVTLNTNSRLQIHFDKRARTVILRSGEAYFNVAHNAHWPFIVVAGAHKVIAIGTSFMVRRAENADSMTVTLVEGRVAVAPLRAPDVLPPEPVPEVTVLSPGERLRAQGARSGTIEAASIDQATGWMRGQLMFDETPLREAAEEFNRYSTVKIKIGSAQAANISVGGVFRVGDSTSFARAVAEAHNLRLVAQGDELLLE